MLNILVTGANGQLGSELRAIASQYPNYHFFWRDYPELDITNEDDVHHFISANRIQAIINCAAYTAVDRAEEEPERALMVNAFGPDVLGRLAEQYQLRLIHISTDYVFNGKNHKPYTEQLETQPIGIYGLTKRRGEINLMQHASNVIIIRTSWLYSAYGNNFVKTMLRLMAANDEIGVIFDQVGTPTYAGDLAQACLQIIGDPGFEHKGGIYHYSNEGVASWYDFALAVRDLAALDCRVKPLRSDEFPTKASRPHYSVLDKSKIKNSFGLRIPYWRYSLAICLSQLKQETVFPQQLN